MSESAVSITEAAHYLNVSRTKIWNLVRKNKLKTHKDPLDERRKLIKVSDLDRLKEGADGLNN